MKFSMFSGVVRCLSAAAVLSFSIPKAKVSADLIAAYNFTGASLVSTANSPIATAGNYVFNSLNTNQHNASSGLSNVFVNAGYAPFNSANPWPATLASSGSNSAPTGGNTGISELYIWNGFTITKASGVESFNFEKVSFQYGASGTGAAAALHGMSLGVYFREVDAVGDFTFLGSAFATAVGTGAGSGGGTNRFYPTEDSSVFTLVKTYRRAYAVSASARPIASTQSI